MLLEETYEGIVRPFDPNARLLGAENRESVTCFLDSLLFGMFARLDGFEAMLYESFEDPKRRKLAGLLRLWVNLLRSGRLITTDITKHLQDALAECGWRDAANLRQQDPSEAYGFITEQLELPLLTLKMDLYHTGKEDPQDDHKFVNERLLEVAIVDEPQEGSKTITLEDCLEHYFNNRIEVKRHMEQQRRNTLQGTKLEDDIQAFQDSEKRESGLHVEIAEVADTPAVSTPVAEAPTQPKTSVDKLRPGSGRKRADSIFSQRRVQIEGIDPEKLADEKKATQEDKAQRVGTRTEVLMPAWQFFKLLPWYTDNMPTSDAQVAAHFSRKRPVLGIALKRYSYTNEGEARRLDTYVDIPLEIAVPNFVSDDSMVEDGPLVGNFRLMLQSVICHRGVSVHSGHYVCLSRGSAPNAGGTSTSEHRGSDSSGTEADTDSPWMRFDDLAEERVSYVNIHEALRQETPYLLFYQVQPIGDDGHSIHDLPTYAEATSRSHSDAMPLEKADVFNDPYNIMEEANSALHNALPTTSETADFGISSVRTSLDTNRALNPRGRTSRDQPRRQSIAFDESTLAGSASNTSIGTATSASVPATPVEEKGNAFLNVAKNLGTRRTSRNSRSRPTSTGPAGDKDKDRERESSRFSLNMSKLTLRMSRADANAAAASASNGDDNTSPIRPSASVARELANERDADTSAVTSDPVSEDGYHEGKDSNAAATPSKAAAKASKKEKKKHHGHGLSKQEDRDCVVM